MKNNDLRVWLHRFTDGKRIGELSIWKTIRWSTEWCDEGTLKVTFKPSDLVTTANDRVSVDWKKLLRKWAVIVVVTRGDVIEAAGPILEREWDGSKVTITCGDGWSLWSRRFVLNYALHDHWTDGPILVDEKHPAPEWHLRVNGHTYTDLIIQLLRESLKWGAAPYVTADPVTNKQDVTREYFCWDFATVYDRIQDLTEVIGGPEVWFRPVLKDSVFHWDLVSGDSIGQHHYRMFTADSITRCEHDSVSDNADDMTYQAFGVGGKSDDHTMIVRELSTPPDGMPILQSVNKDHSTLNDVKVMRGYLQEDLKRGDEDQDSFELLVDANMNIVPGDLITLSMPDDDWFRTNDMLRLKVLEISGDSDDHTQTLGCRRV